MTTLRGRVTQSKIIERDSTYIVQAVIRTKDFPVVCIWKMASRAAAEAYAYDHVSITGELQRQGARHYMVQPHITPDMTMAKSKTARPVSATYKVAASPVKPKHRLRTLLAGTAILVAILSSSSSSHPAPQAAQQPTHTAPAAHTTLQDASTAKLAADAAPIKPVAVKPSATPIPSKPPATPAPEVNTPYDCDTQSIPFTATTRSDPSLAAGTSRITTVGLNGGKNICYPHGRLKPSVTTVVYAPVTQVTSIGSYVAPTPAPATYNTYTNVDGNHIESPDDNTSGANAQCRDGSYSHSVHRSGTCSGHGGVANWL